MWVYQEQKTANTATQAQPAPGGEHQSSAAAPVPAPPAPAPEPAQPPAAPAARPVLAGAGAPVRRRSGQATRDCLLLAAAYLLGTAAAGVLQALCEGAEEAKLLAYYLESWRGLFALSGPESVAALFGAEYLAAAGAVTVLLLLGLSAFGPVLIFLFVMLYGAGAGLLTAQLYAGLPFKAFAAYLLLGGLPTAAAAACLCVFGASALQVSSRLHAFSFGSHRGQAMPPAGARLLLGQYLLAAAALLPLCGAATGLIYFANRLPLS